MSFSADGRIRVGGSTELPPAFDIAVIGPGWCELTSGHDVPSPPFPPARVLSHRRLSLPHHAMRIFLPNRPRPTMSLYRDEGRAAHLLVVDLAIVTQALTETRPTLPMTSSTGPVSLWSADWAEQAPGRHRKLPMLAVDP